MPSTFMKRQLSGSTNGRPIKITATSTPGTLIHTATSSTDEFDEIYLWAVNTSGSSVALTVEWGGVTSPDDFIAGGMPIEGDSDLILIAPGLILGGGLIARAFAATTAVINIVGFVNRISQ